MQKRGFARRKLVSHSVRDSARLTHLALNATARFCNENSTFPLSQARLSLRCFPPVKSKICPCVPHSLHSQRRRSTVSHSVCRLIAAKFVLHSGLRIFRGSARWVSWIIASLRQAVHYANAIIHYVLATSAFRFAYATLQPTQNPQKKSTLL